MANLPSVSYFFKKILKKSILIQLYLILYCFITKYAIIFYGWHDGWHIKPSFNIQYQILKSVFNVKNSNLFKQIRNYEICYLRNRHGIEYRAPNYK